MKAHAYPRPDGRPPARRAQQRLLIDPNDYAGRITLHCRFAKPRPQCAGPAFRGLRRISPGACRHVRQAIAPKGGWGAGR